MNALRMVRFCGLLAAACPWPMRGAEVQATDDDLRMPGVFESILPGIDLPQSLRLDVHPHVGDLQARDYLRTTLGLRYAFSQRWEGTADTAFYVSHGLGRESCLARRGFSQIQLGSKYRWREAKPGGWECSVGLEAKRPMGTPPVSATDGLQHVTPYAAFAHDLAAHPGWRIFLGTAFDEVTKTGRAGRLARNQLDDDAWAVSAGVLRVRGSVTCTLETNCAWEVAGRTRTDHVFRVRPGLVWVVPPRFRLGAEGKWLLGCAVECSIGPEGTRYDAFAKVRVNFDIKRLLGLR